MHELLLFGQIPASRHDQVLNILGGVAAMQPVSVLEKHLVFKPNKSTSSTRPVQVGGAQDIQKTQQALIAQTQGDIFYMQLVTDIDETLTKPPAREDMDTDLFGGENDLPSEIEQHDSSMALSFTAAKPTDTAMKSEEWTLQFRDLPEVGRQRPVTSRLIADIPIISGSPTSFMSALDYTHTSTFVLSGQRFTHLSTSILLYRLLLPSNRIEQPSLLSNLDISQLRLLDPSGTYILQAAVRVQDGSKVETMTKGANELLSLKETLKGVVELEPGDRLALDTRVR